MDSTCYTTQSLERLSTEELVKLAEKNGLDIPHDLERVFIIEELLQTVSGAMMQTEKAEEHAVLSKHHTVSIIEVIVRDPHWAFVFWDIKKHIQDIYEADPEFEAYCLRVIPLKEDSNQPDMAASFIVPVTKNDSSRYLGFPPDDRRFFKIELCVPKWDSFTVLAVSRSFRMPQLIEPKRDGNSEIQSIYRNPMAQLSGVDRFTLLRDMDRPIRPRRE